MLIVLLIPVTAGLLVVGLGAWARDVVRRNAVIGGLGVVWLAAALANLVVERQCDDGTNRLVVGLFVSDHACHRSGVIALEVALLALVATAALVRLGDVRR